MRIFIGRGPGDIRRCSKLR